MNKSKTTGELLEALKKKTTYSEGKKELSGEQYTQSLSAYLNGFVARRDMKLSDIMHRSGLKKSYFYSLFDGSRENPARDVLIQLCFGFQLSFDETQEFLKHLGAAQLYPRIARDGVIIYALHHSMDIIECDILLAENGEEPLTRV